MAALVLVTLGLEASFRYTEVGKALIAATDSPLAAALLGMPLRRLAVVASGLSGFIGAIAGVLLTPILTVSFNSDVLLAVNGFIAAAIGGLESPLGAVGGGIFIGVVEGLVAGYSSPSIKLAVALGLMILALVARAWVQEDVG
ncbi:MAG: hypothetical protein K6U87_10360 [Firmicutes bacterium]|nr:hypothetical protein [Bacillota bacterium]